MSGPTTRLGRAQSSPPLAEALSLQWLPAALTLLRKSMLNRRTSRLSDQPQLSHHHSWRRIPWFPLTSLQGLPAALTLLRKSLLNRRNSRRSDQPPLFCHHAKGRILRFPLTNPCWLLASLHPGQAPGLRAHLPLMTGIHLTHPCQKT